METLTCSRCRKSLPFSAFNANKSRKNRGGYEYHCKECRRSDYNIMRAMLSHARVRAKKKHLSFDLTLDFLEELQKKQNDCCAYTNIPLNWEPVSKKGTKRVCPFNRASLDRKDPTLGYTQSNVQLVIECVNVLKSFRTEDEFLQLCKIIGEIKNK